MPKKPFTWPTALDLYETHLRLQRLASRTVTGYLLELKYLEEHLAKRCRQPSPGEVTVEDLRAYQCGLLSGETARSGKPISAGTVCRVTTTLTGFFAYLVAEGLIPTNPTTRLERPRVPHRVVGDVLTVKEAQRFLAAADRTTPKGLRDRAIVEILYATGVRRDELRSLDLGDLDRTERELTVRHGKGDKSRLLPITRSAFEILTDYLDRARPALAKNHPDSGHAVFLSPLGRRLGEADLLRILRRLRDHAKIDKNVTPHTLRRTFATHLLKGGVNLRCIQTLLGHASMNTTAVYLRLNNEELRREVLLHHPRERFET